MLFENNKHNINTGWIEIITGSMFSGKTEELIRRLKRAMIANQKVKLFKPSIDNRYAENKVISHDENELDSISVSSTADILKFIDDEEVIAIDEVQFFNEEIIELAERLANEGKRVILAGLDMDYLAKPFSPMPQLMAIAEYVTKIHAICVKCGNLANYSHRKISSEELVEIGEKDVYEPLCRSCYNILKKDQ